MNNLPVASNNNFMGNYRKTDNITNDVRRIIDTAQQQAYRSVDSILVQRNWIIGYRIAQEELNGEDRADYGKKIITMLAEELSKSGEKGFDRSSLYMYLRFYKYFPEIVDSLNPQSAGLLSWTHYRVLIRVHDDGARAWYAKEAYEQMFCFDREHLIKSARADSEDFFVSAKFEKWRNTGCISHFSKVSGGEKRPLLRRRRFIQRFHRFEDEENYTPGCRADGYVCPYV